MFKKWINAMQQFCYYHFPTVVLGLLLIMGGAWVAFLIDPIFAIISPVWLILPAYAFKSEYAKKLKYK